MATSANFPTSNQYIKYKIEVTENSTSVANNTSSVTVKVTCWRTNQGYTTYGSGTCYCNINGTSYSQGINSSQKFTYNSNTVIFSQTVTIPHNADGNKSIFVEAKITHNRFTSDFNGFTVGLSFIPREATLTGAQNFNDEQNPVINYSNPAGNAVTALDACISLTGSRDDVPYRAISKTGSSYTFNLTSAERTTLRNACANSNSLTVYFYVRTQIGGQTFWNNRSATMTIVNGNPTITGASYKDNNSTTVGITTNNQYIIQNQSQLVFNFSSLKALKSATLRSVAVTVNAVTKSINLSGTSQSNVSLTFGTLNTTSNATASIVLTDSRNNKSTASLNVSVYAWSKPVAMGTAKRLSNFYSETTIKNYMYFSSLGGHNTCTCKWEYKKKTASSYTYGGTLAQEQSTTFDLDNTFAWDVRFTVTDRLSSSTKVVNVPVGTPLMFFDTDANSVGIMALPVQPNEICVGKPINIQSQKGNIIGIFGSSTNTGTQEDESYLMLFSDSSPKKVRAILNSTGCGYLQLFNSNGAQSIYLNGASGNVLCVSVTQTSSRKVKENIEEMSLEEAEKILQLVAVTFDYKIKEQGTDQRGFIAEDVAEIIPELVTEETADHPAMLNYLEMIPYLQRVIKAQDEKINDLETRLKALEEKLKE